MKRIVAILLLLSLCIPVFCFAEALPAIRIPVVTEMKRFDLPDNEALRFVRDMKTGWDLGNTFDAYNNGWFTSKNELEMEKYWCQAYTTRELIQAISAAGFRTIRIPVSWHDHVDDSFTVSEAWMNRVKEVVDWAIQEDMYVILNVHHDNEPNKSGKYFYPDSEHYDLSAAYLGAVWLQIAQAFAEYDDHVILESMNEPRLVNTDTEWGFSESDSRCQDAAECINRLNQLFVTTVRSTGGNNATRYLAVPGYCASPMGVLNQYFRMPEDTADNRIILSVHAYTPYNFALNTERKQGSYDSFDLSESLKIQEIARFMNDLYKKYVSDGIPVVIDEYGALNKSGNLQDRVNFAAYYTCAASARGMTCCWWDNHNFTGQGEQFGLIDRNKAEWIYPEIVEAIMANCLFNRE